MDRNLTEENLKKMKKMRYDKLISEGLKPSEALHTIEYEQKKGAFQERPIKIQTKSTLKQKLQSGVSNVKAAFSKEGLRAAGKFIKEDIREDFRKPTIAEIKEEYKRVKAQAEAQKQLREIRKFHAGKKINQTTKELRAQRKHELALAKLKYQAQKPRRVINQLDHPIYADKGFITGASPFDLASPFDMDMGNPFVGKRKKKNFLNNTNPFGL
ncbi:MAG: hypothetical protein FIB07_03065 [Candidatus Methanoperedens sp.]|nr:hypothetical protein [Candidatus Methanoperedens sp.]